MSVISRVVSPVTFADPRAEPGAPIVPYDCRLDLRDFDGRVTMLANAFPDSIPFVAELAEALGQELPEATLVQRDKGHPTRSSAPLDDAGLAGFADGADAVVAAFGHCGSCTSAIVRDGAGFARLGVPSVVLVTAKFAEEAAFVARAAGMPELPTVLLPHPVSGMGTDRHREVARAAAASVLRALEHGSSAA